MRQLMARLTILLAVLLMPFGMAPVPAASHHMMRAAMPAHCPEQGSKHQSDGAFADCTMACASALPAADRVHDQHLRPGVEMVAAIALPVLRGMHPDTATPPPKAV